MGVSQPQHLDADADAAGLVGRSDHQYGALTIGISYVMSRLIERYTPRAFLARLTAVFAGAAILGIALLWLGPRDLAALGLFILSETCPIWVNLSRDAAGGL